MIKKHIYIYNNWFIMIGEIIPEKAFKLLFEKRHIYLWLRRWNLGKNCLPGKQPILSEPVKDKYTTLEPF